MRDLWWSAISCAKPEGVNTVGVYQNGRCGKMVKDMKEKEGQRPHHERNRENIPAPSTRIYLVQDSRRSTAW